MMMTSALDHTAANDAGRQRFAVQDYSGACEHFTVALRSIGPDHPDVRARYLCNRAAAHLQLRNYGQAIDDASAAVKLDATNVKAWIRRGDAHVYSEAFERAVHDYDTALKLLSEDPGGAEAVQAVLAKRKTAVKAAEALKRANAVPDAAAPAELLSSHHSKRVYFRYSVPQAVQPAASFPVAVYVANEFGLHKRGSSEGWRVCVTNLSQTTDVTVEPPCPILDERGQAEFRIALFPKLGEAFGVSLQPPTAQIVVKCQPLDDAFPPLPVVSPPISVVHGERDDVSVPAISDVVVTNCRLFDVGSRSIVLLESIGELGVAGRLWDCGVILLQYFAQYPECLAGKCVLELGAGTGVVGLGVGALGASEVIITDMPSVCPLIDSNIHMSGMSTVCRSTPLMWGDDVADDLQPDVVVAADVVYEPEYFHVLVVSLVTLCSRKRDCVGFLAYRPRHPDGQLFFEELGVHFVCEPLEFLPAACKGITIFKLTMKAR